MASINRPEVTLAGPEAYFDLSGHMRVLQVSYMPKTTRNNFEEMAVRMKEQLGTSKVNDTLVYRRYRLNKAIPDYCNSPGDSVGSLKARVAAARGSIGGSQLTATTSTANPASSRIRAGYDRYRNRERLSVSSGRRKFDVETLMGKKVS